MGVGVSQADDVALHRLPQLGQGGGGHGLAYTAGLLVGQGGVHEAGHLRVLVGQHLLTGVQDDVAAPAGHDATQQQHVLEAVEVVVQGQGVAQVHADGAVDGLGGGTALVHQLLDLLELLSRGEVGGQADAGGGSQLDDGVLGEVFDAAADVAGPLVLHGVGGHVHRGEGQLVEPAGDVAVGVHVAHGLAGTHGDAQNVVFLQAYGAGQGGHVKDE